VWNVGCHRSAACVLSYWRQDDVRDLAAASCDVTRVVLDGWSIPVDANLLATEEFGTTMTAAACEARLPAFHGSPSLCSGGAQEHKSG